MSISLNFTQTQKTIWRCFLDCNAVATCSMWTQEEDDVTVTGGTRILSSTYICVIHRLVVDINNNVIYLAYGCPSSMTWAVRLACTTILSILYVPSIWIKRSGLTEIVETAIEFSSQFVFPSTALEEMWPLSVELNVVVLFLAKFDANSTSRSRYLQSDVTVCPSIFLQWQHVWHWYKLSDTLQIWNPMHRLSRSQ